MTLNPCSTLKAQSVWTDPRDPWIGTAPYFTDATVLTPALAHQTDEYRFVPRIEQATELYYRLVQNWCAI